MQRVASELSREESPASEMAPWCRLSLRLQLKYDSVQGILDNLTPFGELQKFHIIWWFKKFQKVSFLANLKSPWVMLSGRSCTNVLSQFGSHLVTFTQSQLVSPTLGNKSTCFYAKVSVDLVDLISWNHCTVIRYSLQDLDTVLVLASPIFTTNLIKFAGLWFNALNGSVFSGQNHRTFKWF